MDLYCVSFGSNHYFVKKHVKIFLMTVVRALFKVNNKMKVLHDNMFKQDIVLTFAKDELQKAQGKNFYGGDDESFNSLISDMKSYFKEYKHNVENVKVELENVIVIAILHEEYENAFVHASVMYIFGVFYVYKTGNSYKPEIASSMNVENIYDKINHYLINGKHVISERVVGGKISIKEDISDKLTNFILTNFKSGTDDGYRFEEYKYLSDVGVQDGEFKKMKNQKFFLLLRNVSNDVLTMVSDVGEFLRRANYNLIEKDRLVFTSLALFEMLFVSFGADRVLKHLSDKMSIIDMAILSVDVKIEEFKVRTIKEISRSLVNPSNYLAVYFVILVLNNQSDEINTIVKNTSMHISKNVTKLITRKVKSSKNIKICASFDQDLIDYENFVKENKFDQAKAIYKKNRHHNGFVDNAHDINLKHI